MSYKSVLLALSPSAYWPLDQSSIPADVVGSITTALEGGAALGASGPLTVDPSPCATFDGSDDRINISDTAALDLTTNWSVSFFFNGDLFNHAGGANFPRILSKGSGSGVGYQFLVDHAAGPKLAIQTQGLSDTTHQTVSNVSTGTWYHVVTTYDGSNVRIYLDGTLDYTGPATGSVTTNATALYLGQRGDAASRWDGRIAHVGIWNGTVLSGAQVTSLYAARTLPADTTFTLPYLHARVGIARVGASLVGDYYQNPVIMVDGVDLVAAEAVQRDSLEITLEKNDVPSSARFTVTSFSGVVPEVGQVVEIGLGSIDHPIFGGQVISARYVFEADRQLTPWVKVTCGDWSQLFNRRLITADFSGQAADAIATAIVENYTTGFTADAVTPGLDTIEEFICINERPLDALKRLAVLVGGGVRIAGDRNVHFWDVDGEDTDYANTPPEELVSGLWSLRDFSHDYDFSQVRTRVIVEGNSTQTLIEVPAGESHLPIEYSWMFAPTSGRLRIGTQDLEFLARNGVTGISGRPGAQLTVDANPGDTSLTVADATDVFNMDPSFSPRWFVDEAGNAFRGEAVSTGAGGISLIPASGYGSIQFPIPAGSAVYVVDAIYGVGVPGAVSPGTSAFIKKGEAVVVRHVEDDSAAQAAIAALEGEGDGIHEFVIADSDLSYVGVAELAQAQLAAFSEPLAQAHWTTEDLNTFPGSAQDININLTGGITDTVTIDRVVLTFPVHADPTDPYPLPLRRCEGSTVRLEGLLDLIQSRVI